MVTLFGIAMVGLQIVALAFAGGITLISLQAYRRTGRAMYRYAAAGFVMLGGGLLVESVLFQIAELPIREVHTVEGLLFVAGFGLLYYSIRPGAEE